MKKYYIFLLLLFLFTTSLIYVSAHKKAPTIIIDVGHGGKDPGTVVDDIYEKNINLDISFKIKKALESRGIKVLMTRDGDYDLASPDAIYRKKSDFNNRIKFINNSNADFYLSVHVNYLNDSSYYGPQVFYEKENFKVAKLMQKKLNKVSNTNRNIKFIPRKTYMYDKINIPGLLIECGFLSNKKDRKRLLDEKYKSKIANTIAQVISKQF